MRRGFLAPGVSSAAHGRIAEEAPFLECLPDGCVYEPSASGVNENLLLLLHGHGDEAPDGRTWFGEDPDKEDALLAQCVADLIAVIDRIVRHGYKHRQLHLCGFSDGGQVALELALRHHGHRALGSCVALSAALMCTDGRQRTEGPHTPILMTRGDCDDIVTEPLSTATVVALLQAAPSCGAHVVVVPGKEHCMPRSAAEMRPVMEFWSHTIRVRPPATDDETVVELT